MEKGTSSKQNISETPSIKNSTVKIEVSSEKQESSDKNVST